MKPKFEWSQRGDVSHSMDKSIGKQVFKIRGRTAATNFIEVPARTEEYAKSSGLALTGRFVYIQLRAVPHKLLTFHMDIITKERQLLRLSFSSMFSAPRFIGNLLRLPLTLGPEWTVLAIDVPAILEQESDGKFSADSFAMVKGFVLGATASVRGIYTSDQMYDPGTLPRDMALPLNSSNGATDKNWEDVYKWSWLPHAPGQSVAAPTEIPASPYQGKSKIDIPEDEDFENEQEQSNVMDSVGPPSPHSARVASAPVSASKVRAAAMAAATRDRSMSQKKQQRLENLREQHATGGERRHFQQRSVLGLQGASQTVQGAPKQTGAGSSSQSTSSQSTSKTRKPKTASRKIMGKESGGARGKTGTSMKSKSTARIPFSNSQRRREMAWSDRSSRAAVARSETEAITFGTRQREEQMVVNRMQVMTRAEELLQRAGIHMPKQDDAASQQTDSTKPLINVNESSSRLQRRLGGVYSGRAASQLQPDPILQLERVVGYTSGSKQSGTTTIDEQVGGPDLLWAMDSRHIVFASRCTIVVMEAAVDPPPNTDPTVADPPVPPPRQRFLTGHTNTVTTLAFNSDGSVLASGQTGGLGGGDGPASKNSANSSSPSLRLWHYASGTCLAMLPAHHQGLSSLSFSHDDRLLCSVGRDKLRRVQIIVWDVSKVHLGQQPAMVARQISDYDIRSIKFSPYEPRHLVSCGRENVRFWRISRGHLPARPAVLQQYARSATFTAVAFESMYGHGYSYTGAGTGAADAGSNGTSGAITKPTTRVQRHVFTSCASEGGLLLQMDYDECTLVGVYRLHDGPIHCLAINEGYCVTGAADKFLRVWPLDFSDYFIEAQHEGEVATVDISPVLLSSLHCCCHRCTTVLYSPYPLRVFVPVVIAGCCCH
jgi:WD40 repeat protein